MLKKLIIFQNIAIFSHTQFMGLMMNLIEKSKTNLFTLCKILF